MTWRTTSVLNAFPQRSSSTSFLHGVTLLNSAAHGHGSTAPRADGFPPHPFGIDVACSQRRLPRGGRVGRGRAATARLPRRAVSRERHASGRVGRRSRSEEHTSELQSLTNLVCRLLLEKKKTE